MKKLLLFLLIAFSTHSCNTPSYMFSSVSQKTYSFPEGTYLLNIIDAPGYLDFQGESKCALKVSDFAAVVVSAVNGIEVGTELMWEIANEYKIPKMLIFNLMDRDNSNYEKKKLVINSTRYQT